MSDCKDLLPEQDVAGAFRHAQGILRDRQEINEAAITDAILAAAGNPEDEEARSASVHYAPQDLRAAKLEGWSSGPTGRFARPPLRKVRTTEGVTFDVSRRCRGRYCPAERLAAGAERFTIETACVTEDKLVRDPARWSDSTAEC